MFTVIAVSSRLADKGLPDCSLSPRVLASSSTLRWKRKEQCEKLIPLSVALSLASRAFCFPGLPAVLPPAATLRSPEHNY